MKTSELVETLAGAATPAPSAPVARRLTPAIALGVVLAFGLLIAWLGVSPLTEAVRQRWFWMKGGYTLSLAVGALMLVAALSRPGRTRRWAPVVIGAALA